MLELTRFLFWFSHLCVNSLCGQTSGCTEWSGGQESRPDHSDIPGWQNSTSYDLECSLWQHWNYIWQLQRWCVAGHCVVWRRWNGRRVFFLNRVGILTNSIWKSETITVHNVCIMLICWYCYTRYYTNYVLCRIMQNLWLETEGGIPGVFDRPT